MKIDSMSSLTSRMLIIACYCSAWFIYAHVIEIILRQVTLIGGSIYTY